MPPAASSRLSRRAGYFSTSVVKTSPTVAPSTETVGRPSAAARSTVGSLISTDIGPGYNPTSRVRIPGPRTRQKVAELFAFERAFRRRSQFERGIRRRPLPSTAVELYLAFGDVAVDDAVGAQHGLAVAQAHDRVPPIGIDGLAHVGRRRVGVGVRMAVPHTHELVTERLGGTRRGEIVAPVDGIDHG